MDILEKKDTQSIKLSNQDFQLDKNVEKNIIEFFNEDIISQDTNKKKDFGTDYKLAMKISQSLFNNEEDLKISEKNSLEYCSNNNKNKSNPIKGKRKLRKKEKIIDKKNSPVDESSSNNILKTYPQNSNLKDKELKCFQNKIIQIDLDNDSQSK